MFHEINKLIEKAQALLELDRPSEAIPLLLKALSLDPQHLHTICSLSFCHYQLKDYKTALEYAEKGILNSPENEWGHRLRSLSLGELKKKKESLKSALTAVSLAPEEPNTLQTLVSAQLLCEKPEEALETAEKLLELSPDTEEAHMTVGSVHLDLKNYYLAEKHFKKALQINPTSYYAQNNLGVVNLQQNLDLDERNYAIKEFTDAVKLDPANSIAIENLRIQFSILPQLVVFILVLPIIIIGIFIIPLISVIMFFGSLYQLFKTAYQNWRDKSVLPDQFLTLFKSETYKQKMERSAKAFWEMFINLFPKLWLTYLFAVIALALRLASFSYDSNFLGALSYFAFFACPIIIYKKFND